MDCAAHIDGDRCRCCLRGHRFRVFGCAARGGRVPLRESHRRRLGCCPSTPADGLTSRWLGPTWQGLVERSAKRLDLSAKEGSLAIIAERSRGTPRVANRLLKRVRDYAQVRGDGILHKKLVDEALDIQQVDELGLDELDRAFLMALIKTYNGGPAGIEALAATMGQERDTLEDMVEPYLLQIGFVIRTRQGRQATKAAYDHLRLPFHEPTLQKPEHPTLF